MRWYYLYLTKFYSLHDDPSDMLSKYTVMRYET